MKKNKTILVTGGAGFIGLNVSFTLKNQGHKVVVLDNFSTPTSQWNKSAVIKNFPTIEGSILNHASLKRSFEHQIETVVHLAAKTGVRKSIADAKSYYKTNVLGTLSVLEAMRKRNIKQIIFSSSSSVYGDSKNMPFRESEPLGLSLSPYAATKVAGEEICKTYGNLFGINTTIFRFFTVYGPGNRPDMAMFKFLDAIVRNKPITVFGDGLAQRDFTYVDDISKAIAQAVTRNLSMKTINLGNNYSVPIRMIISNLETIVGKKAIIRYKEKNKSDMKQTLADIHQASTLLQWVPSTNLSSGLKKLYKWYIASNFTD